MWERLDKGMNTKEVRTGEGGFSEAGYHSLHYKTLQLILISFFSKDGVCVRNWWVLDLLDFKNEAMDPPSEHYSS